MDGRPLRGQTKKNVGRSRGRVVTLGDMGPTRFEGIWTGERRRIGVVTSGRYRALLRTQVLR